MSLPENTTSVRQNKWIAFHNGRLLPGSILTWIVDAALHSAAQRDVRTDPARGITEALAALHRITQKHAAIFDDVGRPTLRAAS